MRERASERVGTSFFFLGAVSSAESARGLWWQVLEKRLCITKHEFMVWLHLVLRDDNASAMRRACVTGRQRLEERGLLPRELRGVAAWQAALSPMAGPSPDEDAFMLPPELQRLDDDDEAEEGLAQAPTSPSPPDDHAPGVESKATPTTVSKSRAVHDAAFGLNRRGRVAFKAAPRALGRRSDAARRLEALELDDHAADLLMSALPSMPHLFSSDETQRMG